MFFIDFMVGNTSHNLMYSATPTYNQTGEPKNRFSYKLTLAWQSLLTYEPLIKDGFSNDKNNIIMPFEAPYSDVSSEDKTMHEIARLYAQAEYHYIKKEYDLALKLIDDGLEIKPKNELLLKERNRIEDAKKD